MLCCGTANAVIEDIARLVSHGYSEVELSQACDLLNKHVEKCPLCSRGKSEPGTELPFAAA